MKEPNWIDERDATTLHEKLLMLHGGASGIRDSGLLTSALARPRQQFAYADEPDMFAMAAAYTSGVVRNHPFIDGNKRTGFVIGILFLEINGHEFRATEELAAQTVVALAASEIDEPQYLEFLRSNSVRQNKC